MEYSLAKLADVISVCSNTTVTQGGLELDIPSGSLIDMSIYSKVWVLVMPHTIGDGDLTIKFYDDTVQTGASQAQLLQWDQTAEAAQAIDFTIADGGEGKVFAQEIHPAEHNQFLNIGAIAPAGTGNSTVSITVLGVKTQYSAEVATVLESGSAAELTIA